MSQSLSISTSESISLSESVAASQSAALEEEIDDEDVPLVVDEEENIEDEDVPLIGGEENDFLDAAKWSIIPLVAAAGVVTKIVYDKKHKKGLIVAGRDEDEEEENQGKK